MGTAKTQQDLHVSCRKQGSAEFGLFELCGPSHYKSRRVSEMRNSDALPAVVMGLPIARHVSFLGALRKMPIRTREQCGFANAPIEVRGGGVYEQGGSLR